MSDKSKLIAFFRSSNLVSLDSAQEFTGHFTEKEFKRNDYLLTDRKINDNYFFLENGFMRAYTYDVNQNDVATGFYSTGQIVFEVSSFFNRTISKENIQALTNCQGWGILMSN